MIRGASPSPVSGRGRSRSPRQDRGPHLRWSTLLRSPSCFADALEKHRYVILTDLPDHTTGCCSAAASAMDSFFACESSAKRAFVCREPGVRCGYRVTSRSEGLANGCFRESYQVRGDAGRHQPWPSREVAVAASRCALALEELARRCLTAALRGAAPPSGATLDAMALGPSVLDAFHYAGSDGPAAREHLDEKVLMHEHLDPGFLTIEPRASAPGLQILAERADGAPGSEWRLMEPDLGPEDILVFACESLQRATAGAISGALHRVVESVTVPRNVMAFELRDLAPCRFAIGRERLGQQTL